MPTLIDPAELAELNLRFLAGLDEKGIVGPEDLLAVANLIGPWAVMQAAVCIGQKDGRISFDEGQPLAVDGIYVRTGEPEQVAAQTAPALNGGEATQTKKAHAQELNGGETEKTKSQQAREQIISYIAGKGNTLKVEDDVLPVVAMINEITSSSEISVGVIRAAFSKLEKEGKIIVNRKHKKRIIEVSLPDIDDADNPVKKN
ncbi:hypothetical protein A3F37_04420 [Candidatus Saccharibacteria bacterium RIFCSPHIGHO2_12_FULL_41_12]|nr:MAG: hypothetical protein A3F37_04420 [Candidatus Saccharibacteria bacterium RIFCSPHIGHO2_12_FULL_41_12]